jgi:hypothetical protein
MKFHDDQVGFDTKWNGSAKTDARHDAIIVPYRDIFGPKMPETKQYLTYAGGVAGLDNKYECHQMVSEGLIEPHQFHGFDINPNVVTNNLRTAPQFNWHYGDLAEKLIEFSEAGKLNPAIVHIDHTKMLERAMNDFLPALKILTDFDVWDVLLVFNFMTKTPYSKRCMELEEIEAKLSDNQVFRCYFDCDWKFWDYSYHYEGVRQGKKQMRSVIMYRK